MNTIETYYLVDYENVHIDGLEGCDTLKKSDHIIVFFTQNAKNMDLRGIANCAAGSLNWIEVPAGKQSADIHMGSYLGYLAGKQSGEGLKAVIVSKDTDFDNVIKFCKERFEIKVSRAEQIKKATPKTTNTTKTSTKTTQTTKADLNKKAALKQEVMQAIRKADYSASVANTVAQVAENLYGSKTILEDIQEDLKGRYLDYKDVYKVVKPIIKKYTETTTTQKSANSQPKDKTTVNNEVMKSLRSAKYGDEIVKYTTAVVLKHYNEKNGKQTVYRSIISKYGQEKGLAIYNQVKKCI